VGDKDYSISSCGFERAIDAAAKELKNKRIISRIRNKDHTVWKPDPAEIANRLGWLDCPKTMRTNIAEIEGFVADIRDAGFTKVILLGMGGSSLAPEVFRNVFGIKSGYLDLTVLDSTHPDAVMRIVNTIELEKTLFIVSTKSGGTVETLSFAKFFYKYMADHVGAAETGRYFIAITDPGSGLERMAGELNFRKTFLNDPDIGGRFAALSYFGLVPAAILGIDLEKLLDKAEAMADRCFADGPNPGAWLGVVMGELAEQGRDKLTLVFSKEISPLGAWAEQLIAESTGKEGKGILPVNGEELLAPEYYSNDRFFVYAGLEGENDYDARLTSLKNKGFPVIRITSRDLYDLGAEFFRWEMATAVAGWRLGTNPFDQPNVESAKVLAREMAAAYARDGSLPEKEPALRDNNISVYGNVSSGDAPGALRVFLDSLIDEPHSGAYVAIQAYLNPSERIDKILQQIRTKIQKKYRVAVTSGYGPRFLHSTGQLHKGDSGKGVFVIFTDRPAAIAAVPDNPGRPDSAIDFATLISAQALGDGQALLDNGRKVIRFHFVSDTIGALEKLSSGLGRINDRRRTEK